MYSSIKQKKKKEEKKRVLQPPSIVREWPPLSVVPDSRILAVASHSRQRQKIDVSVDPASEGGKFLS